MRIVPWEQQLCCEIGDLGELSVQRGVHGERRRDVHGVRGRKVQGGYWIGGMQQLRGGNLLCVDGHVDVHHLPEQL